jgi:AraC-like DNA-binding protein
VNFYAILIITDGSVEHIVDFNSYSLTKGDCLIIAKGQVQTFDKNSKYIGSLFLFTEEFMQKYISQSTIAHINLLYNYFLGQNSFKSSFYNERFMGMLTDKLNKPSLHSQPNFIGAALSIYLLELAELRIQADLSVSKLKSFEVFSEFQRLLISKHDSTHDAKVFAGMLAISYKHLNEICKQVVNKTTKQIIDDFVILEAKRLLVASSLLSKEISYILGFDEPTNFNKYFKKHTYLSPADFRNNLA